MSKGGRIALGVVFFLVFGIVGWVYLSGFIYLLMAKFDSATLTIEHVCELTGLKEQTIRNRMVRGEFPRTIPGAKTWRVQDVADWIDGSSRAPDGSRAA